MPAIVAAVASAWVAEAVGVYVANALVGQAILGAVISGTMATAIGWVTGAVVGGRAGNADTRSLLRRP